MDKNESGRSGTSELGRRERTEARWSGLSSIAATLVGIGAAVAQLVDAAGFGGVIVFVAVATATTATTATAFLIMIRPGFRKRSQSIPPEARRQAEELTDSIAEYRDAALSHYQRMGL